MPRLDTYTIGINIDSKSAGKKLKGLDDKVKGIGKEGTGGISKKGLVLGGIGGVALAGAAAFGSVVNAAADVQTAITGVGKTTGIAGDELNELKRDILDLGKKTAVPTERLFEMAEVAGTLGVKGSDNIIKFTDTIAKLDLASKDFKGAEAASTLQTILTLTGEGVENVDKLASSLVVLGNEYNATEGQAAKLALEVASGLQGYGLSSDEVITLAGALAELKVPPEIARSGLQRLSLAFSLAVGENSDELKAFADVAGVTSDEFARVFEGKPYDAIRLFTDGLAQQRKEGMDTAATLDELGLKGVGMAKVVGSLVTQNEQLKNIQEDVEQEYENAIAITNEAETANSTYQSSLVRLKNSFLSLKDRIGSAFLPLLTKLTNSFSSFFESVENGLDQLKSVGQIRQLDQGASLLEQRKKIMEQIGETDDVGMQQQLALRAKKLFIEQNKIESSARPDLIPTREAPSMKEIIQQSTQINIEKAEFQGQVDNYNELANSIKTGVNTDVALPNGTGF